MTDILGIPCTITEPRVCAAISKVLRNVKERYPEDFKRLQYQVKCIEWLPAGIDDTRSMGHWTLMPPNLEELKAAKEEAEERIRSGQARPGWSVNDVSRTLLDCGPGIRQGYVQFSRALTTERDSVLLAAAAHWLGRAATSHQDYKKRARALAEAHAPQYTHAEWACANYYAYRWGFGRQVRNQYLRLEENAAYWHQLPGDVFRMTFTLWRVSRNFYFHLVNKPQPGQENGKGLSADELQPAQIPYLDQSGKERSIICEFGPITDLPDMDCVDVLDGEPEVEVDNSKPFYVREVYGLRPEAGTARRESPAEHLVAEMLRHYRCALEVGFLNNVEADFLRFDPGTGELASYFIFPAGSLPPGGHMLTSTHSMLLWGSRRVLIEGEEWSVDRVHRTEFRRVHVRQPQLTRSHSSAKETGE